MKVRRTPAVKRCSLKTTSKQIKVSCYNRLTNMQSCVHDHKNGGQQHMGQTKVVVRQGHTLSKRRQNRFTDTLHFTLQVPSAVSITRKAGASGVS